MKVIKIHLVDDKIIEIKERYGFIDNYLNKMNNNDDNIMINNYIIPKSSVNYIEFVEVENEED